MLHRAFRQVDVFTAIPYVGNPLAVVLDGCGLDDAALQRLRINAVLMKPWRLEEAVAALTRALG